MADEVVIGGYRRVRTLQTGQNSEVWEVVDPSGRQRYALKLLLTERATDKLQRIAIRREASIGMKLQHPNIIRFYKFGTEKKIQYIVMEYFPATNLKLRIMRNEIAALRPVLRRMLTQFAHALDYFHSKGWVHCDIKPDNLLVNNAGDVRLIDFAIAVRAATGLSRLFSRRRKPAGTRSYMSPEQIRGLPLDRRADLYSTGVMLYELLAGKLPYSANSGQELLRKHLQAEVPTMPREAGVDPAFEKLVRRMMAKKPADRPASMEEFLRELRTIKIHSDENPELT